MSLINQVLKDLEQRHAQEMAEATHDLDGLALAAPLTTTPLKIRYGLLAVMVLMLVVAGAAVWWWQHDKSPSAVQTASAVTTVQQRVKSETNIQSAQVSTPAHVKTSTPHIKPTTHHRQKLAKAPTHKLPHPVKQVRDKPFVVKQAQAEVNGTMEKQMVPLHRDQKAEIAYQAGYDQIELHNLSRAEEQLRRALSFDPAHVRAREMLAGLMIRQGRWVETAGLMQQGVALRPKNTVFLKIYARVLMQLNRDRQAITVLRAHAPSVAQDPEYYALLAALYQRQQDHRDAAKTYSEILKLRPDAGIWWVGLGISLEALGKQQQAQEAYARARKTGTLRGDLARFTDNRLLALDAINYPIN